MSKKEKVASTKTLKTFNLNSEIYSKFSTHCKSQGISMSKKIENFIKEEVEKINSPTAKSSTAIQPFISQRKYVD